jgi:hypothetical protein
MSILTRPSVLCLSLFVATFAHAHTVNLICHSTEYARHPRAVEESGATSLNFIAKFDEVHLSVSIAGGPPRPANISATAIDWSDGSAKMHIDRIAGTWVRTVAYLQVDGHGGFVDTTETWRGTCAPARKF